MRTRVLLAILVLGVACGDEFIDDATEDDQSTESDVGNGGSSTDAPPANGEDGDGSDGDEDDAPPTNGEDGDGSGPGEDDGDGSDGDEDDGSGPGEDDGDGSDGDEDDGSGPGEDDGDGSDGDEDDGSSDPDEVGDEGDTPDAGESDTIYAIISAPDSVQIEAETFLEQSSCFYPDDSRYIYQCGRSLRQGGMSIIGNGDLLVVDSNRIGICRDNEITYGLSNLRMSPAYSQGFSSEGAFLTNGFRSVPDPRNPAESYEFDTYENRIRSSGHMLYGQNAEYIYTTARATQLPGESPDLTNRLLLVKYSLTGERIWESRITEMSAYTRPHTAVSPDNSVYLLNPSTPFTIIKVTEDGTIDWSKEIIGMAASLSTLKFVDENTGYLTGRISSSNESDTFLAKFDIAQSELNVQPIKYQHEVVVDQSEEVIWSGTIANARPSSLIHTESGPCLAFNYQNQYRNGSTPRLGHSNILISCFDEDLNERWSKIYRLPSTDPFTHESHLFLPSHESMRMLPSSNTLRVATGGYSYITSERGSASEDIRNPCGSYVFDISLEDGTEISNEF